MDRKIIILVLFTCLFSCRELYNDYQSELNEEYLVVEGMISDDPGPYYVSIVKALAYSNDMKLYEYRPEPETQAAVWIRSDKGEDVAMVEVDGQPGTYATRQEEITGQVGHSYWIRIETQQGEIYESYPSMLMEKPDVPNLYAAVAENIIVDESLPGGPRFVTQEGMQITCDVLNNSNANYVKIDLRTFSPRFYYADSTFSESIDPMWILDSAYQPLRYRKADTLYCWILRSADAEPHVVGTGNKSSGSLVMGIPLSFIRRNGPFSSTDTIIHDVNERYTIQDIGIAVDSLTIQEIVIDIFYSSYYIADVRAYAINDTIYEYYRNLKNQVTANNKIFDPIPANLDGNIRCLSNPGKNIYGIFTVASVMKKQFFIRLRGYEDITYVEELDDYFPVQTSGCVSEMPGFWRKY